MATLAELLVTIGGDTSGLDGAVGKSQSKLSKFGGFAKKAGKLAATGIVAAGAAAIGAAFKTAEYGDEIAKTSTKLGVNTDALQEMRYWAERNGISAQSLDRGVGRLNQRIGRAVDGNEKYAEAFADVGVSLQNAQGDVRDTEAVMVDTIQALAGIEDPALQSARASEIFGTKMARDLMPALQDGSLSMEDAAKMAHELGIVMDEDATKSAEKFQDAWADLKDTGMGLLREFGTPVMEFLADKLFPAIQDKILPALKDLSEWLGPKLSAAGELIGKLWDNAIGPAFNALSDWWDEHGPAIIEKARELWDGLVEVFDGIKEAVKTVIDAFQDHGATANGVWQEISDFAQEVWPKISDTIGSAMEAISAIIETVAGWISDFWDEWGSTIMELASNWWEMIKGVISGALDAIQGIFEIFAGVFTGDWDRVWEGIKQLVDGVCQVITSIIEKFLNDIITIAKALMQKVKDAIEQKWNEAIDFIKSIPGKIKNAFSGAGSLLFGIGKDIIQGLINGIKDMAGSAADAAKGVVNDAISGAKNLLRIGSPSKVFEGFGHNIGEGLSGGIESMGPLVEKASAKLAALTGDPMAASAAGVLSDFQDSRRRERAFPDRMTPSGVVASDGRGAQVLELRLSGGGTGLERMFLSWLQGALRENPGVRLRTVNN